jgi:hypothetical protein
VTVDDAVNCQLPNTVGVWAAVGAVGAAGAALPGAGAGAPAHPQKRTVIARARMISKRATESPLSPDVVQNGPQTCHKNSSFPRSRQDALANPKMPVPAISGLKFARAHRSDPAKLNPGRDGYRSRTSFDLIPALDQIEQEQRCKPSFVRQEYQMLAMHFDHGRTHMQVRIASQPDQRSPIRHETVCA